MVFYGQTELTLEGAFDLAFQNYCHDETLVAEDICLQILEEYPDQPDTLHLVGVISHKMGKLGQAADLISRALKIKTKFPEAHNNLGTVFRDLGKLEEAIVCYQEALFYHPEYDEAYYNLGNVYKELGRLEEAIISYQKALSINPSLLYAHYNLGNVLQLAARPNDAAKSYNAAIRIKPNFAEAYNNLGNVLHEMWHLDESIINFNDAISIRPNFPEAHNNLGTVLRILGRIDEAVGHFRQAIILNPDYVDAHSNLLCTEQYRTNVTPERLKELHVAWDQQHGIPLYTEWLDHKNTWDSDRPLRVGLVSPSLRRHPVGYFVIGFLEHRPVGNIETFCYSERKPDDMTERLMSLSDNWFDTRGISDAVLTNRIQSDKIDILIDLAGHAVGNRLLVFARKPAPIQIEWVAYVGTTGLSAMDYLMVDRWHVPEGSEHHYTEKIFRLPDGYHSYDPPEYAPQVGPLPYEKNGFITFGCFNNPAKCNSDAIKTWAEILRLVPNSRMLLKYGNMDGRSARERIYGCFGEYGINESRVILEGASPHIELLSRYNDVDIALDTFPYVGGLTTCEAIWMGVPVVTFPGKTFAGRHSYSHLSNIGVFDLICRDVDNYIIKAIELANDVPRLKEFRLRLRNIMSQSNFCNGKKFANDFSAGLRQIWQEWCSKKLN